MIQGIFNKFFSKGDQLHNFDPVVENAVLTLKLNELIIGYLSCKDNEWTFVYSDEFRKQNEYHNIVGFPDLDEEYKSSELWPFFRIRIPGLKQPAIKEILEKEKIKNNEYELLKRFGRKSISNPYELVC
jgi:HipA-like protein